MAEFAVNVVRLDAVEHHPNADALDIVTIGGYKSITMRDVYKAGDLAVYIPENALVPDELLEAQGLKGALSGPQRNRVKPKRLRGIFSEGLVFPLSVLQGTDVASALGITKWEPTIPAHMAGNVFVPSAQLAGKVTVTDGLPLKYDIENIKKYMDILEDDEEVVVTEKVHGTFIQVGWCADLEPSEFMFGDGRAFVASKGLGARGVVFKNDEINIDNLYVKTALAYNLFERVQRIAVENGCTKLIICGEVFGSGVQDLEYGASSGDIYFRAFDMRFWNDENQGWVGWWDFTDACFAAEIPTVPVLAFGKWAEIRTDLSAYTDGNTTLTDKSQIREGCVVKPVHNRRHPRHGRVIYKSISEAYALRKNATELT